MAQTDPGEQSREKPAGEHPAADGPPPPTTPPPPPATPPRPASEPRHLGGPHPGVAPPAPVAAAVDLRVSKRLLWIGDAYYPLQNVARVHTLTIHPRRKEAVVLFLKRLLLTGLASTFLGLLAALMDGFGGGSGGDMSENDGGSSTLTTLVVIASLGVVVYAAVEMARVLGASPHFVLAVETAGPSTAVVTSPDPGRLRWLAERIADAIENPEAEFSVRVDTLTISPKHYYFGDNVNMYGGQGNVGMAG